MISDAHRLLGLILVSLGLAACGDDATSTPDTDATSDGDTASEVSPDTTDTTADTTIGDEVYGPRSPPAGEVPEALRSATWIAHYEADLEPYWTSAAALGTPVGNYPTYRTMTGEPAANTKRRPRMISRQIFAYVVGYLMTGEPTLLDHAQAGVTWLREHAIDRTLGGCHPELTADGAAIAGTRTAQDQAYCMLGLAAWYYLTRDPLAEADLLAGRDLLFDPDAFWDADAGRIRDALDQTMTSEVDVEGDGGSELVAQLDPINAFMLLVQPVLGDAADRERFLADLRALGQVILDDFRQDGLIWGVSTKRGEYRSKHADFGHAMKAVWMVLQIDKRLDDHPFHDDVAALADPLVTRAFDLDNGRWAKRPTSASAVEYGSDWWIYAEADQLTATLDLADGRHAARLAQTQAHWLTDYVDEVYPGEVIPGIKRDGSPVWSWPATDTAKCNEWKNGYHSTEHALVLSIVGAWREGEDVVLHFALPDEAADTLPVTPYVFQGRELGRTPGQTREVGGRTLRQTTVRFSDIY